MQCVTLGPRDVTYCGQPLPGHCCFTRGPKPKGLTYDLQIPFSPEVDIVLCVYNGTEELPLNAHWLHLK